MVLSYYMNAQKQKVDRWPQYLKYSVKLDGQESIIVGNFGENRRLIDEVQTWLEENIGYTTETSWHKDKWHPAKPKFLVDVIQFPEANLMTNWCLIVRFYDETDAMAFKLTWT